MTSVIIDPCYFTQTALKDALLKKGITGYCFDKIMMPQQLNHVLHSRPPKVVFISEQCFDNHSADSPAIKNIISRYPDSLFVVFMALSNNHFSDYLYLRENIVITTKQLDKRLLERLVNGHLKNGAPTARQLPKILTGPVSLSRTESEMLEMWMSGYDTLEIAGLMKIKSKTISAHKGNIKKKIKTQNKQVIYHLHRLTRTLTSGINCGQ